MRRLLTRRSRVPRRLRILVAFACAFAALGLVVGGSVGSAQQPGGPLVGTEPDTGGPFHGRVGGNPGGEPHQRLVSDGRALFLDGCSSCHGQDARGIPGRGPSLRGVGALAADFYLRTGRMPLDSPKDEPVRKETFYDERQIAALDAYVGSFGGPPIPAVHASKGDLSLGMRRFSEMCMGCHQVVGQGGLTTRAWVPDLRQSRPIDVAEAVRIGPYVMPTFASQLTQHDIDSIARYVEYTRDPEDVGGWGIGHIGPIPEGMVTWLLAGVALLLTIRLIGERTTE